MYKRIFKEKKEEMLYNYRRNKKELDEEIIFCSNNSINSRHYGDYQRIFTATRKTLDLRKRSKDKLKLEIYYKDWIIEYNGNLLTDEDDIEENINPNNIVSSAGAWDNVEFISYLYDYTSFYNDHDGVITNDGAVFFEVTKVNLVSFKKLNPNEGY